LSRKVWRLTLTLTTENTESTEADIVFSVTSVVDVDGTGGYLLRR
jgi:hypothetical protein